MTKREILDQVKAGKITAEEALKLLETAQEVETIEVVDNTVTTPFNKNRKPKWLIVKVREEDSDKTNVNIRVPLALVKLTKKLNVQGENMENFNYDELMKFIEENGAGKFIDIQSKDGSFVEISVE
jgi:hypothetical protein